MFATLLLLQIENEAIKREGKGFHELAKIG